MSTSRLVKPLIAAVAVSLLALAAPHSAQAQHVRGTLSSVTLSVETAKGGTETVKLAPKAGFFLVSKSDLNAIQPGKFVGITSVEKDGKSVAVEVHVFAESLRGVGEGHDPWDLETEPNMMTNGNIAKVEEVGSDHVLKVDYKGGEQSIAVPPNATVVFIDKATPDQLVAGRKVFIVMKKEKDGSTDAVAVVIGAEGVKPPM
jgi:hypothetical protein